MNVISFPLSKHIVTCILIIKIMRELLNFTKSNFCIRDFFHMLQMHMFIGFKWKVQPWMFCVRNEKREVVRNEVAT